MLGQEIGKFEVKRGCEGCVAQAIDSLFSDLDKVVEGKAGFRCGGQIGGGRFSSIEGEKKVDHLLNRSVGNIGCLCKPPGKEGVEGGIQLGGEGEGLGDVAYTGLPRVLKEGKLGVKARSLILGMLKILLEDERLLGFEFELVNPIVGAPGKGMDLGGCELKVFDDWVEGHSCNAWIISSQEVA